jgi:hypothetical protein
MEQVAKMLGVELNEEFEIVIPNHSDFEVYAKFCDGDFKITKTNFLNKYDLANDVLRNLLNKKYTIKRKPWKPQYNERYYSIGTGGVLEGGTWLNDFLDIALYRLGNCYKTPEEAALNVDKWVKFCKSDHQINI